VAPPVLNEVHTPVCCAHPYYGFVCTPNSVIDYSDKVPPSFGHGAIAVIDRHGFRNSDLPVAKPTDEYWIGLFGGSVAFSVSASDNAHTIAGCLERELNVRRFTDKRVRVVNYALPGGQQPQQLLILLLSHQLLDGVITFDGVNEIIIPSCYNLGSIPESFPYRPYYELLFGRTMSDEQVAETWLLERDVRRFEQRPSWQKRILGRFHQGEVRRRRNRLAVLGGDAPAFRSLFGQASGESPLALALAGARHWSRQTALMQSICRQQSLQGLFLVQPIPDRGKPLTAAEQQALDEQATVVGLRSAAYDELLSQMARLQSQGVAAVAFTDVFASLAQPIYTDLVHFEDAGCRVVAERMASLVVERWTGFDGIDRRG